MPSLSDLHNLWDRLPLAHWSQRVLDLPNLIKWARLPKNAQILEVGCGSGRNAMYLSGKLRAKSYIATDKNPSAIARAETRNESGKKVIFQVADIFKLPFDDQSFDAVVCVELLHHVKDWKKALREIHRVLKKNGKLLLKEFSIETFTLPGLGNVLQEAVALPSDQMFDQIELLSYIRKNGFEIVRQNDSLWSLLAVASRKN